MKNPFTKVEVGSTVQPPNGTGLALLKLFRRDGGTSIVLPAEQAEYAALAINQHERLVALVKDCRKTLVCVDSIYPARFIMPASARFDALLAEETKP